MTRWIEQDVVLAIHEEQINEHGGLHGIRDLGLLESCLARPRMLEMYGDPPPDIAQLAATYAHGIDSQQAFIEGNTRTSSVVTRVFLRLNGYDYVESAGEATRLEVWKRIALGLTRTELADWIRANIARLPQA